MVLAMNGLVFSDNMMPQVNHVIGAVAFQSLIIKNVVPSSTTGPLARHHVRSVISLCDSSSFSQIRWPHNLIDFITIINLDIEVIDIIIEAILEQEASLVDARGGDH